MDYGQNRLNSSALANDQKRWGFHLLNDETTGCTGLTNAINGADAATSTSTGYVVSSICYRSSSTEATLTANKMVDYDNVVQAFEQCDPGADNTCCKNGRFTVDGATCATGDSQVCFSY